MTVMSFLNHAWIFLLKIYSSFLVVSGVHVLKYNTHRYKCSSLFCAESVSLFPLIQKVKSGIECSTICSRKEWCNGYTFGNNTSYLQDKSKHVSQECSLLFEDSSECLTTAVSTVQNRTCMKVHNLALSEGNSCGSITQKVLDVNVNSVLMHIDYVYAENLLVTGNELIIQFVNDSSTFITRASYITIGRGNSSTMCATIFDSIAWSPGNATLPSTREFCIEGSPDERKGIVALTPVMEIPIAFSWISQRKQKNSIGKNKIVFTTGGNSSLIEEAINNGCSLKILNKASSSIINADLISQNNIKRNHIAAQTAMYANGQYKIVSYFTTNAPKEIVLLDLFTKKVNNHVTVMPDIVWFSDQCWKLVHITNSQSKNDMPHFQHGGSINDLIGAVDIGQRVRVRFIMDELVILATPNFVGIDDSETVVVHVLRAISHKSVLDITVNIPGVTNLNQSQWSHFYITSNGSVSTVDSSKVTSLSDKATIFWYAELQNYTMIHSSSSSHNSTSMSRLISEVTEGKSARVKVYDGKNRAYYSCNMIHIILNGSDVKCQVNGQLGVDFLGTTTPGKQFSITSALGSIVGPSSTTGCFQTLVILASVGSIDHSLSCLGRDNSTQIKSTQPKIVEWFVFE